MNTNIIKTLNYIRRNGPVKGFYAILERLNDKKQDSYHFVPITEKERLDEIEEALEMTVSFSILVPAYETTPRYMRELIDSVRAQTYSNWQLVIADASKSSVVKDTVSEYDDNRIQLIELPLNEGISENSNKGIPYCTGDYTGLLDHDDVLTPDALFRMAKAITKAKNDGYSLKMLYSDEDKTDSELNSFFDGHIKGDFDLDLIMSNNYICHFLVLKTSYLKQIGFDSRFDGAQDHNLVLNMVTKLRKKYEREYEKYIRHIPHVLYHWRCHEASTAANPKSKEYAYTAGKMAVQAFVDREKYEAKVCESPHVGFFYVDYDPDILIQRRNVAAVGGRVVEGSKVVGGVYDENMNVKFLGLNKNFSGGIFHKASVWQRVPYVDIRYMRCSKEVLKKLDQLKSDLGFDDVTAKNEDYIKLSKEFCDMMKGMGYYFLYDPHNVMHIKRKVF